MQTKTKMFKTYAIGASRLWALGLLALAAGSSFARASTRLVTSPADSGAGSLREVIIAAQSGDQVVFDPSLAGQTITLTSGQLAITKSLDIEGPGADELAVSGNHASRVFSVSGGVTVTIAGLTITDGRVVGEDGGGILNVGSTLILARDVLSHKQALGAPGVPGVPSRSAFGGAIMNASGATLTVTDSLFTANRAVGGEGGAGRNQGFGGGLENAASTATIRRSTFIGNKAIGGDGGVLAPAVPAIGRGAGGAIHHTNGILAVDQSTFIANQARGGANNLGGSSGLGFVGVAVDGGLSSDGTAAVATVTNSTFDHNEALGGTGNTGGSSGGYVGTGQFGGIGTGEGATFTARNIRLTHNRAIGGDGNTAGAGNTAETFVGRGVGGGFASFGGATATISNSMIADNQALGGQGGGSNGGDALGGGLANTSGATLTVSGCTITDNEAVGGDGGAGGNGFGAGLFNDGPSTNPSDPPTTLTVLGSTVTGNEANGGEGDDPGTDGLGVGGGLYIVPDGIVCIDVDTSIFENHASGSDDDVSGFFTICP